MIVMSLGLAILTLHLVENPARFAATLRSSSWRSLAVGATATGGRRLRWARSAGGASRPDGIRAGSGSGRPDRARSAAAPAPTMTPEQRVQAAVAASAELRAVPSNLSPPLDAITKPEAFVNGCVLSWQDTAVPDCVSGDAASATKVALIGDSHAGMWHPALEATAQQRGWRLETYAKSHLPADEAADSQPLPRPRVHRMQAMASWRCWPASPRNGRR